MALIAGSGRQAKLGSPSVEAFVDAATSCQYRLEVCFEVYLWYLGYVRNMAA